LSTDSDGHLRVRESLSLGLSTHGDLALAEVLLCVEYPTIIEVICLRQFAAQVGYTLTRTLLVFHLLPEHHDMLLQSLETVHFGLLRGAFQAQHFGVGLQLIIFPLRLFRQLVHP
jgi:hypothetical protein